MITEKAKKRIDQICSGHKEIRLTVGVYKDGISEMRLYGCDGVELPYKEYHYEIGSITKTFTAAILAKGIKEGVVSLDDRIDKYIPELKSGKVYPTLKRLATHTSGYPADSEEFNKEFENDPSQNQFNSFTYEMMLKMIDEIEIEDKDYEANYSNFGIGVLAVALEKAFRRPFHELLEELLDELDLKETFIGFDGCTRADLEGYSLDGQLLGNLLWSKDSIIGPAGYLFSTAEDMFKYAVSQINDNTGYLHLCHTAQAVFQPDDNMPYHIGLCWVLVPKFNIIYHNGGTRCFHTIVCINIEKKTAVTMLCNYPIEEVSNTAVSLLVELTKDKA